METKTNKEIREYAAKNGVYLWQIAERLGIVDATLSRWLRKELPADTKKECFALIDQIAAERNEK